MDLFVVGIVVQLPKRRRDILWIILKIFIYILRTRLLRINMFYRRNCIMTNFFLYKHTFLIYLIVEKGNIFFIYINL